MSAENHVHSFAGGDVYLWLEQESSIHLKAASSGVDPVELTAAEVREIGLALIALADQLDALDNPK
jgi:hypothetical protein